MGRKEIDGLLGDGILIAIVESFGGGNVQLSIHNNPCVETMNISTLTFFVRKHDRVEGCS